MIRRWRPQILLLLLRQCLQTSLKEFLFSMVTCVSIGPIKEARTWLSILRVLQGHRGLDLLQCILRVIRRMRRK